MEIESVLQRLSSQNITLDLKIDKPNQTVAKLLIRAIKLFYDFSAIETGLFIPVSSGFFNFGEKFQESEIYFIGDKENLQLYVEEFLNYYAVVKKINISVSGELFERGFLFSPVIIECNNKFIKVTIDGGIEIVGQPNGKLENINAFFHDIISEIPQKKGVDTKPSDGNLFRVDISLFSEMLSLNSLQLNAQTQFSDILSITEGFAYISSNLHSALSLIYLYSLRLGLPTTYFYYIPSVCLLKSGDGFEEKKGYGILALITDKILSSKDLLVLKSSAKDAYLSIAVISEEKLQKDFFISAINKSISSVLSRNYSHNIGSHVMHNTDYGKILKKLNGGKTFYTRVADKLNHQQYAQSLKNVLDRYVVQRQEYLADVSEATMPSGNYARFYSEVVLPFVENFLITDNIAAAEGVGFPNAQLDNWLQIRVIVGKREMLVLYQDDRLDSDTFQPGYPNIPGLQPPGKKPIHLPYYIPLKPPKGNNGTSYKDTDRIAEIDAQQVEDFFHTKSIVNYDLDINQYIEYGQNDEQDTNDPEIAIPGVLGRHAFYSMLENFIRNTSKNGKERIREKKGLEIEIRLREPEPEELCEAGFKPGDAWRISIREDISRVTEAQFDKLKGYVEKPLIEPSGAARTEGLGIADMAVSAAVLAGSFDFDFSQGKNRFLSIVADEKRPGEEKFGFSYHFWLLKAKRVICLTRIRPSNSDKGGWKEAGITFINSLEGDEGLFRLLEGQAYRMALLDVEILEALEIGTEAEILKKFDELLAKLPFRVIFAGTEGVDYSDHTWYKMVMQRRILLYQQPLVADDPQQFYTWCWQIWIARWFKPGDEVHLHLYLEREYKRWRTAGQTPQLDRLLHLHVYDSDPQHAPGPLEIAENKTHVIFDHHGVMLGQCGGKANFLERDAYTIFDKSSGDFQRLIYPDEASMQVLPYQMAEAGLTRILVLDERVAERAMEYQSNGDHNLDRADPQFWRKGGNTNFDYAWASGVHIVTHISIDGENPVPVNDKHERSELQTDQNAFDQCPLTICIDPGKFGKIRFVSNLKRSDGGRYEVGEGHYEMIIVHRTILKQIQEKIDAAKPYVEFDFLTEIKDFIPFVVVDSGGGYPEGLRTELNLKGSFKFLPFSFVSEHLLRKRIAKVGLTQLLMGLTDVRH